MSGAKKAVEFAEPAVVAEADGGFSVELDGKPLRSPAGAAIRTRHRAFAEAIAAEWTGVLSRGKGARVDFDKVPLTRIVGTALDRIPAKRDAVIDEMLAHAETDLLCYRSDQPRDLVARQVAVWQPLLDWLALTYDARLETHTSLQPPEQPAASLAALRCALAGFDDLKLAGLGVAVATTGSLALALALADGRIDADAAFEAAELDTLYQIGRWGDDPVLTAKHAAMRRDLADTQRFFRLALG
ncbi:MAG: ATPase [Rhodospirillales bacterium]|nr:ATPase [Rhodospirillales bacterium]